MINILTFLFPFLSLALSVCLQKELDQHHVRVLSYVSTAMDTVCSVHNKTCFALEHATLAWWRVDCDPRGNVGFALTKFCTEMLFEVLRL